VPHAECLVDYDGFAFVSSKRSPSHHELIVEAWLARVPKRLAKETLIEQMPTGARLRFDREL
jgi:hypothetical protein